MPSPDVRVVIRSNQLKALVRGGDVQEGLQRAAQIVEASAKMHAPVRTGNLRRSIYHEVTVDAGGPVARVGTNVKYGIFQEIGTRHHPAHPFLRPALAELQARLRSRRVF